MYYSRGLKGRLGFAFLAAVFFCLRPALALETVDTVETWSVPGLAGWTGGSVLARLTNVHNYLEVVFPSQSYPSPVSVIPRKAVTSVYPTTLNCRLLVSKAPSALWLCMHSSRSGNMWYLPLQPAATGEWFNVEVPIVFEAGWTTGPLRNRQQFINDILAVDWMGFYVRRGAECSTHSVCVDDMRIRGICLPGTLALSGIVYYEGDQSGPVRIGATKVSGGTGTLSTVTEPGVYSLEGLLPVSDYVVSAYRDSNTNAVRDAWEACGAAQVNPVSVDFDSIIGVNIALQDPLATNGVPLWWVARYFGLPPGGPEVFVDLTGDTDSDGLTDAEEFVAGTDPTDDTSAFDIEVGSVETPALTGVVVRWASIQGRTYTVWRSASLMQPFEVIAGDLPATPPLNTFVDEDAEGTGPWFYRVEVNNP